MLALCLWLALLCAGPWIAAGEQDAVLYDDLGHPFSLAGPPRRIVSLAPDITEILFALNLGPRIVGVTRYCDYPPEAGKKERVGGLVDPSLEKIQVLHPDLVIAFRGNSIGIVNRLRSLGLPVFVLDSGTSLAGVLEVVKRIGTLTFQPEPAGRLYRELEDRRRRLELALGNVGNTPRVFLSVPGQGFWTCGSEGFLNDLILQARGVNIAGGLRRRWLNLTREQLVRENPGVIIVMAKNLEAFRSMRDRLLNDARLKAVEAVRSRNIRFLDEDSASRFGPRLFQALEDVARILHPERFPGGL